MSDMTQAYLQSKHGLFIIRLFVYGLFNRVRRRRLLLKMHRQMDVKEVDGRLNTGTIPTLAWIR